MSSIIGYILEKLVIVALLLCMGIFFPTGIWHMVFYGVCLLYFAIVLAVTIKHFIFFYGSRDMEELDEVYFKLYQMLEVNGSESFDRFFTDTPEDYLIYFLDIVLVGICLLYLGMFLFPVLIVLTAIVTRFNEVQVTELLLSLGEGSEEELLY